MSATMSVLALCVSAAAAAQSGPPATPVRVDPVRQETIQEQRLVTGELRAVRRSHVATREPGLVIDLPLEEGEVVEEGQMLAVLDASRLEIMLRQAEADVEAAVALMEERDAEVALRTRDLELLRSSLERNAANPREVRDAESEMTIAKARQLQAQRQHTLAQERAALLRVRLGDMTITAPFRGAIVAKQTELGEWVGEGDPVVEMISIDTVEAWLNVPQRYLGPIESARSVIPVEIDATGRMITASDYRIVPQIDPKARTFTLVAVLDDAEHALTPGMSVIAWVPTEAKQTHLTIDKDAILRNEAGHYVYVARERFGGEGGGGGGGGLSAMPAQVELLFPVGRRYVVRSADLARGDRLVVEGNERLYPTAPVRPVETPAPATGNASLPGAEEEGR